MFAASSGSDGRSFTGAVNATVIVFVVGVVDKAVGAAFVPKNVDVTVATSPTPPVMLPIAT